MRRQKIFYLCLGLLVFLPTGYFSFRVSLALFDFITFKASAPAQIGRWEIKETNGKFPLKAYYSFEAGGNVWQGATRLSEPWNLNEASAVAALQKKAKENWTVWFNPNDPSKSSLERNFPSGLVVRASICYGVILYFILFFRRFARSVYN
jgi:hypothetical protein